MSLTPTLTARPYHRLRRRIWGGAAALLMLPAVAMLFTNEVNWGPEDFVVGGILLLGTALLLDRVLGSGANTRTKIVWGALIVLALMLVWAELAVGLVGSPWAGD